MNRDDAKRSILCANCGAAFDTKYCGQCGQNRLKSQRSVASHIVQQFLSTLINTESAFWKTFLGMARNPGRVCCEYVAGKRKKYVNPFVYVLVVAAAQVVFSYFLNWLGWARSESSETELPAEVINLLLFMVSLVIALFLTVFFSSSNRNFAETFTFTLFLVGQLLWVDLLCMPIFAMDGTEVLEYFLMPTVWIVLSTWAGMDFFGRRLAVTCWRSVLAFVLTLGLLFLTVMALTFMVASMNLVL